MRKLELRYLRLISIVVRLPPPPQSESSSRALGNIIGRYLHTYMTSKTPFVAINGVTGVGIAHAKLRRGASNLT